ncbi:MAG: hypothetical protein ALECFALPRED_007210 [Alectoria fallacina]|uniref:Uncharacterized protein n=1 Tax=Alectoria fallacina TaxID=1903189 RepID=A0A8H3ICP8_9LECA|nr:MAG: hypothetical protein ALECFALPRED_007210 [Alectoria fallacina]
MYSRLLSSPATLLSPKKSPTESAFNFQADQQLQLELEQAAEQGMVSTRSKDNTPASGSSHPSKQLYPQVLVFEKKRKVKDGAEDSLAQAVTKRRRRAAKSNGVAAPSSGGSKLGRPSRKDSAKVANGGRPLSLKMPGTIIDKTINNGIEEKATEIAVNTPSHIPNLEDEVLETHDKVKPDAGTATRSSKVKAQKERMRDSEGIEVGNENGAVVSTPGKKPEIPSSVAAKATHKRFGSVDMEVSGPALSSATEDREASQEDPSEDDGESEDETPEIVTASAGFDGARAAAMEAAKVAARYVSRLLFSSGKPQRLIESRQEAEKKFKRRNHDQRLRLQAKSAKDSRSKDKPSIKSRRVKGPLAKDIAVDGQMPVEEPESSGKSPQIIKDDNGNPPARTRISGKTPLPLLLPKEILAATPAIYAPILPFSNSKFAVSQKRKFVDLDPKPPKDIKRGNVNVRVLQDNRSILPPKSSQASKTLRESWLTGRLGAKGKIGVPRQKPGGGFVRNQK